MSIVDFYLTIAQTDIRIIRSITDGQDERDRIQATVYPERF
ncbi:hypothetical protein CLOSYM_01431 [[Clostridium] symbiosum ATCC 14940]|uniref:Uncharacterized protein n=1 Tax=[Clostridium] symbiosum ATCC 14940 TaxID=411472 RepID=A0ABC9U0F1_CLOSY|nr:hypothetical protein CLOSYM_01431 [[Clostridium] symbiosum ATCC 14940]